MFKSLEIKIDILEEKSDLGGKKALLTKWVHQCNHYCMNESQIFWDVEKLAFLTWFK